MMKSPDAAAPLACVWILQVVPDDDVVPLSLTGKKVAATVTPDLVMEMRTNASTMMPVGTLASVKSETAVPTVPAATSLTAVVRFHLLPICVYGRICEEPSVLNEPIRRKAVVPAGALL